MLLVINFTCFFLSISLVTGAHTFKYREIDVWGSNLSPYINYAISLSIELSLWGHNFCMLVKCIPPLIFE